MSQPKLTFPNLRRFLLRANEDLLKVHDAVSYTGYPDYLTLVDKLVLALEDRRFFDHYGVDLRSAIREFLRFATLQKHGGASTIDMQLVRTMTGYRQRTVGRKLYEAFLALMLQSRYGKFRILRGYLTYAYFGWSLRGVEDASLKLFNKASGELDVQEAAQIAAMLVYPHPKSPNPEWRRKIERRANYGMRIYLRNKKRFDQIQV